MTCVATETRHLDRLAQLSEFESLGRPRWASTCDVWLPTTASTCDVWLPTAARHPNRHLNRHSHVWRVSAFTSSSRGQRCSPPREPTASGNVRPARRGPAGARVCLHGGPAFARVCLHGGPACASVSLPTTACAHGALRTAGSGRELVSWRAPQLASTSALRAPQPCELLSWRAPQLASCRWSPLQHPTCFEGMPLRSELFGCSFPGGRMIARCWVEVHGVPLLRRMAGVGSLENG